MIQNQLVRESASGNFQNVKDILNKFPHVINQKSSDKTALHVSSHQGHLQIVRYLISMRANLEISDAEGDTALHYACFGNQPEILELLIKNSSNINVQNKNGCTPFHVAVNKLHVNCVRILLKYDCNVNSQDSYGDTGLHDIIGKRPQTNEIIDLILSSPTIDLLIKNKRGFNPIHHAALKGNAKAIEKLINHSPHLIDLKKIDEFAPLHLAALNGHKEVVKTLLDLNANIEILNKRKQTPLLLAVSQLYLKVIETLVEKKSNVNATDENGDTCLHLILNENRLSSSNESILENQTLNDSNNMTIGGGMNRKLTEMKECPNLKNISQIIPNEFNSNIKLIIASYLIKNGADLNLKNNAQQTPLDYVNDASVKEFLENKLPGLEIQQIQTNVLKPIESNVIKDKCKLCDDEPISITFLPCQHKLVCLDCSIRIKRCIECNETIKNKITPSGTCLNVNKCDFSQLLNRIQTLEEAQTCPICMERKKDTAFQCGHLACSECSLSLRACHICREKVARKFKIYET